MNTALVWFRNDLRVNDNASLYQAVKNYDQVIALYCFDPRHYEMSRFGFRKTEKFRAQFNIETVTNLKKNLTSFNIPLFTYHKKPEDIFSSLIKKYNIQAVYSQNEWTTEEKTVTQSIHQFLPEQVNWIEIYDQFLFHPNDIPFEIKNIPAVFTDFRKKCEKYVSILATDSLSNFYQKKTISNTTKIPTLQDLSYEEFRKDSRTAFPFKGGEEEALKRLKSYLWDSKKISSYKKTRNGLVGTDYSSKFSPWLANGSISARTIYLEIKKYETSIEKNESTYWLIFELIWRDYFKYISLQHTNNIFKIGGILQKESSWKNDVVLIQKWIDGTTPASFVNAHMIELKETGWMSNRGRQNAASYFTKELGLDWRIGAAYFESLLIDYDVHSNYGNWMYVAGVGNDPRDRKFNIQLQAQRYDKNNTFQQLWLQSIGL